MSIISSRGVVYSGILCWLILVNLDASFLIFYDIARDCLNRETLHFSDSETRGMCGIAVCGGHLVKISRRTEGIISFPKLNVYKFNGDLNDWECDHRIRIPALGWDPVFLNMMIGHITVACSGEEEEDIMWALCLVTEAKFIHGRNILQRHVELFKCDNRKDVWNRLTPLENIDEPDEKWPSPMQSLITHHPLSQARLMLLQFTTAV